MIVGIGAISGFMSGFFKQLSSILGFILGLLAAYLLYESVAERLYPVITESMTLAQVLSFILIWLIVPIFFSIIALLFTNVFKALSLGWLNNLLGFILGGLKWILLLSVLINVLDYLDADNRLINKTIKKESLFYYPVKLIINNIFPVVEERKEEYNYILTISDIDYARRT